MDQYQLNMPQNNTYFSLPKKNLNDQVPVPLDERYMMNEYLDGDEFPTTRPCTFKEAHEKARGGAIRYFSSKGKEFALIEIESSDLKGERRALKDLGKGKSAPYFTVLTSEEAQEILSNGSE